MRISISGEKSLIEALQEVIENSDESRVERMVDAKDQTELAFGIGEVLSLVGVVTGIAEAVKLLIELKSKVGLGRQKLHLKTALGTTVIEISNNITAEELYQKLGTIIPQP
jgi:hypothetical protein